MLDSSSLQKAVTQLEASLGYLRSESARRDGGLRTQFRAAAIQAFEYTYELGVRMIRRQLGEIVANPGELHEIDFLDLMRRAADAGLIRAAPPFRVYREKRAVTSDSFLDSRAEEIIAVLDDVVADMHFLLAELDRRNRGFV
jgi:hypothetical protein